MLLVSAICLMSLYFRFSMVERLKKVKRDDRFTTIDLRTRGDHLYNEAASFDLALPARAEEAAPLKSIALPNVRLLTQGACARVKQLMAASEVELRLLFVERSLVVLLPIVTIVSVLALAEYETVSG